MHGPHGPQELSEGRLTRRALIGGSALLGASLLAAACTPSPSPGPTDSPEPSPDPDAQVRADVAGAEASLLALYDAVIAAHPALADALSPLREEHAAHAEAVGVPASASAASASAAPVIGSRAQALAALLDAEQQAVGQRTSACEAATGAELARLTALIAASEAGHVEYLRGVA